MHIMHLCTHMNLCRGQRRTLDVVSGRVLAHLCAMLTGPEEIPGVLLSLLPIFSRNPGITGSSDWLYLDYENLNSDPRACEQGLFPLTCLLASPHP